MNEPIKYISKVEIKNLWGRYDIEWNLDPSVNILSGINGSGKSTVLDCMFFAVVIEPIPMGKRLSKIVSSIEVKFNDGMFFSKNRNDVDSIESFNEYFTNISSSKPVTIFVISTFDSPLSQFVSPDERVKTELDKIVFGLQKQYLDYQLNIGKKAIDIVTKNDINAHIEVLEVKKQHNRFLEIIDSLFADTNKKVDRESNELMLLSGKDKLTPYQLSSGEKQILVILMTVLIQDNKPSILFMDEPEVSLHIDWQRKLIQYIKELNPNVQIILATHSPGIILEGWSDKVSEMSDLITLDRQAKVENAK
jgi:energy-coupling factor transporter ATP-binding protein EcfA2